MAVVGVHSDVLERPPSAVATGIDLLDGVYAFVYSRVGNRHDAEDLTQQVAMKALPRLHEGAQESEIRGYLFATARSALATFWEDRGRIRESELFDDLAANALPGAGPSDAAEESVAEILGRLRPNHRRLLELRFLRCYTLREVALEMGKTEGAVKVMQLRALRAAAAVMGAEDTAASGLASERRAASSKLSLL